MAIRCLVHGTYVAKCKAIAFALINLLEYFSHSKGYLLLLRRVLCVVETFACCFLGWLQRQLVYSIFKVQPATSGFDGVLEILCRNGMYTLRSEEEVLTSAQLQENPVNIVREGYASTFLAKTY